MYMMILKNWYLATANQSHDDALVNLIKNADPKSIWFNEFDDF